jgi:hypothetical protein
MFRSSGKRRHWPPESTENLPTLADTSTSTLTIRHMCRGLIQSLHSRASTIRQERQDLVKEISNLRSEFQLNSYPQDFIDSAINSKGSSPLNKEQKPLGSVYIPYVKGVSEEFKRMGIGATLGRSSKLNTSLGVH